jgi:hypothetical protein
LNEFQAFDKMKPISLPVIQAVGKIGYPSRVLVPKLGERLHDLLGRYYLWEEVEAVEIIRALKLMGREAESVIPVLVSAASPHQPDSIKYEAIDALARMGRLARPHVAPLKAWLESGHQNDYRLALERAMRLIGVEKN